MFPPWQYVESSQRKLDKKSKSYEYMERFGLILDRSGHENLKRLAKKHQLPSKEAGWQVKHVFDPFLYDKLACANSPQLSQQMLSYMDGIGSGSRVLDLGCGFGYKTSYLLFKGAQVMGTDISQTELRVLANKAKQMGMDAGIVLADVHSPCMSCEFDNIVASQMFNRGYVNADKVIAANSRLLKKGGEFYVSDYVDMHVRPISGVIDQFELQGRLDDEFTCSLASNDVLNALKRQGFRPEVSSGEAVPTVNENQFLKSYLIKAKK
jgi:SAM-dependent methyltransferase